MKHFLLTITFLVPCLVHAQRDPMRDRALTLKRFLEQHHYRPITWNDSSSAMLFDKWLKELDDDKMLFTQKDMELLLPYRTALDEEMNGKSWSFFKLSIQLFRSRYMFADSLTKNFLAKTLDLSKPDTVSIPFLTYAANDAEMVKRRRSYMKWRMLDNLYSSLEDSGKVSEKQPANFNFLEAAERGKLLKKENTIVQEMLQAQSKITDEMQDSYLDAIAWCYDPHSNYMNLRAKNDFEAEVSAAEYSAGFSAAENDKDEKTIAFLQPGGSAWRSGQLHKSDVLVKIKANGFDIKLADMSAEQLNGALNHTGSGDMEVTVRTSAGETKTVKLVTEKVTDEESVVKSYVIKGNKNIGYINLPGFYSREEEGEKEMKYDGCANDVSKEIIKLKKDNIAGLILDLRNNGGGSMWEAMQLAGIFIDAGPVASVREKDGKISFLKDPNRGTIFDGPMIVLVNGESASASEFLAATLQDYNRALIVGGETYGKGTAQVVLPMDTIREDPYKQYSDFVKVTERKFYRVNGSTVQWRGVVPDIALPDMYGDDTEKEKANLSALRPDMSRAGNFEALPAIPVAALKAKSMQRTAGDPYFQMITTYLEKEKQYAAHSTVPLQWSSFVHFMQTASAGLDDMKEDKKTGDTVITANNSFDRDRLAGSDTKAKEVNAIYLKNINEDKIIGEACKIMADRF